MENVLDGFGGTGRQIYQELYIPSIMGQYIQRTKAHGLETYLHSTRPIRLKVGIKFRLRVVISIDGTTETKPLQIFKRKEIVA